MYTNINKQGFDFDGSQILKMIAVVGIIAVSMVAMTGFASAQTSDTGDVEIDVDNNGTDYEGNVTLVDSAGNDVETIKTDGDGQAVFSSIEYGDYQLKTEVDNSTVESNIFTHSDDTTIAEFDVDGNDLKITGETKYVEPTAPTGDNVANFLQSPSLPVLAGMGLIVFIITGMFLVAYRLWRKAGVAP